LAAEADLRNMLKEASSVMKIDRKCPGPSASLVETEESPESKEGDLDTA